MNRIQKKFEELELKDDFMFGKVMSNKLLCKKTLEVLLGITIEDIHYSDSQKTIDITYEGKSIRLDFYVQDEQHTVYNAEMQQNSNNNTKIQLPKRSRYYQSMIDLNLIEKGTPYTALNKSFIIFICTFDPFGRGLYRYTFQNLCTDNPELSLGDETTKLFFNTKGFSEDKTVSEPLKNFLYYIETKIPTDNFTNELDAEVERIRMNETWRREYMKEILHDFDIKEEGRQEGFESGQKEGEDRLSKLLQFLMAAERSEDMNKAITDSEYRTQLYKEFHLS